MTQVFITSYMTVLCFLDLNVILFFLSSRCYSYKKVFSRNITVYQTKKGNQVFLLALNDASFGKEIPLLSQKIPLLQKCARFLCESSQPFFMAHFNIIIPFMPESHKYHLHWDLLVWIFPLCAVCLTEVWSGFAVFTCKICGALFLHSGVRIAELS
jgi:hypothetical protein